VSYIDGPTDDEIAAFQTATRDLVGIAVRSLELLDGQVSLPQFRMLVALSELGRCPSSAVAKNLQMGASSVTRLGDRLAASGHVVRGRDPRSRSVVTLELTARGRRLVDQVMAWRHAELTRTLAAFDPLERARLAAGLRAFHEAVGGDAYTHDLHGPLPL
jgi:DNA-binding MarR family transcriptional regulator